MNYFTGGVGQHRRMLADSVREFEKWEKQEAVKELTALERLRYFCSIHLPLQAWLDSESLFEDVAAEMKGVK